MSKETVTIECDDRHQLVLLTMRNVAADKAASTLPQGYEHEDVSDALLATGHIRQSGETLYLCEFIRAEFLSEMLAAMLSQFDAPGIPTEALLDVQASMQDFLSGAGAS